MADIEHEVEPEGVANEIPQFVPSVYLEVSKEQLEVLDVGKNVAIKLLGKVKALRADEGESDRYSIDLELKKVSIVDDDNEFTKMAEDE
jgi:predicted nucleic acid-binding protein